MKKFFLSFVFVLFVPLFVFSQQNTEEQGKSVSANPKKEVSIPDAIQPVIRVKPFVKVGHEVTLDASASHVLSPSENGLPSFSWVIFRNGETIDTKFTKSIKYKFNVPGVYKIKLNIKQGREKRSTESKIVIYSQKAVFVTDQKTDFLEVEIPAAEKGIWLKKIVLEDVSTEFSTEEDFIYKYQENLDFIKASSLFIFATKSNLGLSAFSRFWQRLSDDNRFSLESTTLVRITEGNLEKELKLVQPVFETLQYPILIAHKEILPSVFTYRDLKSLLKALKNQGYDYRLSNKESRVSPFMPLRHLINYFSKKGVGFSTIYLLLSVPFLAFIIAFARQFIGISTYGVFTPLMLSLSFMVLGPKFGLSVFTIVLFLSYIIRVFFERVELLYIPRLALLMSVLSLSFFLILGLALYLGTSLNLALTIFPMMVMSTISEKFIVSQSKSGLKRAVIIATETIFVAFFAYRVVEWHWLKQAILATPEFILLPIFFNIMLGKFTGLRLSEYFRFSALLSDETQE